MKPVSVVQTGVGASAWKSINFHAQQVNLGIGVGVTGDVTYTVEYTYDDVNNLIPASVTEPLVFPLTTMMNKTTSADSYILWPIAFLRINVTEGAGTARMVFVQSDIEG